MCQGLFRIWQHRIERLSYSRVVEDIKHYTTIESVDPVIQEVKLVYHDSRLGTGPIAHLYRHTAHLYIDRVPNKGDSYKQNSLTS
jgi:hypothetical protein